MGKEDQTEVEIRAYRESDQDAVVALWRECGLVDTLERSFTGYPP